MRNKAKLAGLAAGISFLALGSAQAVEIEYWQYVFDTRVQAMDQLIEKFEAANPDITVKQVTFPYADYQTRVVAAKVAGAGPDDIENYTNRSPCPMLHLLREASVEAAVEAHPDTAQINERNIETMRALGHEGWRRLGIGKKKPDGGSP